jgi:hypothetical protein
MHMPSPSSVPRQDDDDDDVRQSPVPPDQQQDIVPIEDPPKPGRHSDEPPMRVCFRS